MKLLLTALLLCLLNPYTVSAEPTQWSMTVFFMERGDNPEVRGKIHTCVPGDTPGDAFEEAVIFAQTKLPAFRAYKFRITGRGCNIPKE